MGKLNNKVALITGGNSGIGLATAELFVSEGAKVAITGRDENTLKDSASKIGSDTLAIKADVLNLSSLDHAYQQVETKMGKIDVLVVNAGIFKGAPLGDFSEELFDEIVDINFKGTFFTVKKALPYLNDGASIVITGSAAAEVGVENASVYSASKAAVRALARNFSADLLSRKIRVNVLSPGHVETPIHERLGLSPEQIKGLREELASGVPVKRVGTAEEMAKGYLFLASDDSSFVLGAEIVMDGGWSQL
ncbi:SDR family oxidoreductase [Flavobacterium alkalisoli]|uniref:SDR family oxidoreductase n=1 Tax=Flavobacterium alkalisoli TaxID=2602769 RepID=A0A5B9FMJ9_9FLAO|nr:SDR family oxidoreductase [Flavobacterium alkalisoli]QEE48483.1 SDR family oxidoreductase [Flavobacterium alkalisoli]